MKGNGMNRKLGVLGWAAAVGFGLLWGCGDDGGSGGGAPAPTQSETVLVQKADAAGAGVDEAMTAASEGIIDTGSGDSSSASKTVAGAQAAPTPTFTFQKSVSVVVDLDGLNAQGNDRYPNATGVISVSAAGTLSGGSGAGHADYAVQVTYDTEAVFTDPVSGATATVAAGASFSYALAVDWVYTDAYNWAITHVSHAQVQGLMVTVAGGGDSATVSVEAVRDVSCALTRAVGSFSAVWSVSGIKEVTIVHGAETHTVKLEVRSLAEIYVTVDGTTYGPYTAAQLRWLCAVDVN